MSYKHKKNFKNFKTYEQAVLMCSRNQLDDDEKEYVRALIKQYDMDWSAFLGAVLFNRVGGVVYRNIQEIGGFPRRVTSNLRASFESIKERTILHQKEIKKIDEEFEKQNIRFSFLKGSVLNTMYYEQGERMSNDTDLLVDVNDLKVCSDVLEKLGYTQGTVENNEIIPATKKEKIFARLNTYEIVPFVKKIDSKVFPYHEVDINFRLGNDDTTEFAQKMLAKSIRIENGKTSVRTLDMENFFVFLCIHHYREATMIYKIISGDDLTLYKYLDIHMFIKKTDIDWNKVVELSKKMGTDIAVYHTLYHTEIIYPGTVEDSVFDMFGFENIDFVNQYKGRDNTEEIYEWENNIYERFFNVNRRVEALKNIEKESDRFKEIQKQLRK